jgi:hypothetical protein
MSTSRIFLLVIAALFTTQVQASVAVSIFEVSSSGINYGLTAMILLMVAIGLTWVRRSS